MSTDYGRCTVVHSPFGVMAYWGDGTGTWVDDYRRLDIDVERGSADDAEIWQSQHNGEIMLGYASADDVDNAARYNPD